MIYKLLKTESKEIIAKTKEIERKIFGVEYFKSKICLNYYFLLQFLLVIDACGI